MELQHPALKAYLLSSLVGLSLLGTAVEAMAAPTERTSSYTYHPTGTNGAGLVATMNGPRTDLSDITSYAYDASGNLISITNPLSHVVQMSDYNGRGLPGKVIDANGVETVLTYHVRGWLTSSTVKHPGGTTALDAVTTYAYDAVGQVTRITSPDGSYLDFEYDAAQRLTAIQNNLGERVEYSLDAVGNRTQEIIKNSASTIVRTQTRVFDELSRLLQDVGANSQTTQYAYDKNDNPTQITDPKVNPTGQAFDALNRLVTQTDPDNFQVGYTYDDQDRIKTVTDQRGLVTTYYYDAFGNLTSLESPDTGATTYDYDNAGNRIQTTDARGVVTNYSYDAINRLLSITYPASPSENVTYSYDDTQNNNRGIGRLTRITDESGQIDLTYDHRGNLIQKSYIIETTSYSLSYQYDLANNLTGIIYPSGRIVNYSRDTAGRVAGVTTQQSAGASVDTVISSVAYLPFGPMQSYTYGNGVVHSMNYDQDYRITDIEDTDTANTILDLNYGFDPNSNITALNDQDNANHSQSFQYDKLNRLEQAIGNYGQLDYQYDGVGNRTQKAENDGSTTTTDTYNYSTTSNRLNQISSDDGATQTQRTFNYDANGNLIQDNRADGTRLDLSYNHANRYISVDKNVTPTAAYLYNALGQRVAKVATDPAANEHYHYNEGGQMLLVSDTGSQVVREYIYLDSMRVALLAESAATNQPPTMTITAPATASTYTAGDSITFTGTATDPEDGDIAANIQWSSSLDGAIGSGASVGTTSLTVGVHAITASITDSDNVTSTQDISVTVNSAPVNLAPTVAITAPATGSTYTEGSTVTFVGTTSDPEDGDITANIQWSSSLDGAIGSGASVGTASLTVGVHTITASITDAGNVTSTQDISVTVNSAPPLNTPTVNITAPTSGSSYTAGDSVTLTGTATDVEDGDLSSALVWASDLSGVLGTGASVNTTNLAIGAHSITASVTDSSGASNTAQISVTIAAAPVNPSVDFNTYTLQSYNYEANTTGSVAVEDGGISLRIVGNRWHKIAFPYTVTANTKLEFDFSSSAQGEIHGIGFENDNYASYERTFQVYGTQNWGNRNFTYTTPGVAQHFVIPVGQYYPGIMNALFFIMDHDVSSPTGESRFSNVKVYESAAAPTAPQITSTPKASAEANVAYQYDADNRLEASGTAPFSYTLVSGPTGMSVSPAGYVSWTPTAAQEGTSYNVQIDVSNSAGSSSQTFQVTVYPPLPPDVINFNNHTIDPYVSSEDQSGSFAVEAGGASLYLEGNRWKKINLPYSITADTVLEFDFSSSKEGEIQGIGMANDLSLNTSRILKIYGTQNVGVLTYDNYAGGGSVQHYQIPIGQHYTGAVQYLFFVMDADSYSGSPPNSRFTNIKVYEPNSTPVAPQITSTAGTTATVDIAYVYDADSTLAASGTAPISYALLSGPAGMSVSTAGVVSWTPQAGQEGSQAVQISATNSAGSDTQSFSISVAAAPVIPPDIINFNNYSLGPYDPSEDSTSANTVTIEDGGATLYLDGNLWKKIDFPYNVTANTIIEFDYSSSVEGEIHAIGFDDNLVASAERAFKVHGSQSWGNTTYDNYPGNGSTQHYVIPVGQYYSGYMQYLFFLLDADQWIGSPPAQRFSNVKVYETTGEPPPPVAPTFSSTPGLTATVNTAYTYDADNTVEALGTPSITYALVSGPTGMSVSSSGVVSWTPQAGQEGLQAVQISATNAAGTNTQSFSITVGAAPADPLINFNTNPVVSYNGDTTGPATIEDNGYTVKLEGNVWKMINFPYLVTADTVIELDFQSDIEGEIHGIGFDADTIAESGIRTFQLHGTQNWGNLAYNTYSGDGSTQHYVIPVGQFYTGQMQYLTLVMDADSYIGSPPNGRFSNVQVYESGPVVPQAPSFTSTPSTTATVGAVYAYDSDSRVNASGDVTITYALVSGPTGMTVAGDGLITWTPQAGQEGAQTVDISATNSVGSDTQQFTITVAAAPPPPTGTIDFNSYTVSNYNGDGTTTAIIEDNGATLKLEGDSWVKIGFPYTLQANTVIEFDFQSDNEGEVHGIGLDDNATATSAEVFKVHGTESFGNQTYDNYPGDGSTQHYLIPVGQYYTGSKQYLFFTLDADSWIGSPPTGRFSNVKVYEQ